MNRKDLLGARGESIFSVLITTWCGGRQLFIDTFLGAKHETKDFMVELIEPTSGHANFYVQVKATTANYSGSGANRRLLVKVTKEDIERLKEIQAPCYLVGIDVEKVRGYITAITQQNVRGIGGISTRHSLNCRNLKRLWQEVD